MADNPTVPWLAQPIAADDIAGVLVQRVKLQIGGDGAGADVAGDAANGIDVDVTRMPAVSIAPGQTVGITGTPNVAVPGGVVVDPVAVGAATVGRVVASATVVTLAAANANRRGMIVFNDSASSLLVKYGAGATAASFTVRVLAGGYWEMPNPTYTGQVTGIWEGAGPTGGAQVTEV